jgi:hypothetical protein
MLLLGIAGCSHALRLDGYNTHLSKETRYHPPAKYYLSLDPANDGSGRRPLKDNSELQALWYQAAKYKCGSRVVEVTYGPELARSTPEFCKPFSGEHDCAPSIHGYFRCN